MLNPTKILIAGCGDIGHRLAALLLQQGCSVVALKRNAAQNPLSELTYIFHDLSDANGLKDLDSDFDWVFFCAATGSSETGAYEKLYQQGLKNLQSQCALQQKKARWIFISSTRVYGQRQGEWVDETSSTRPDNDPGKLLVTAEEAVLSENRNNIIVRFSGIYGPSRRRLIRIAQNEEAIQCTPPYYTNRIHQEDCAAVLFFLFERMRMGSPVENYYLASDDEPASMEKVMTWIAEQIGTKKINCKPQSSEPTSNKRCKNQRLKELGFRFRYPSFREGYAEMLAEKP